MSKRFTPIPAEDTPKVGSVQSYVVGFLLSIGLTCTSFGIVWKHIDSEHVWGGHGYLTAAIMVLALVQLIVQLVFFLHLSHEQKPRMQSMLFVFTSLIITIVVVGSLWIMANLDYSHGGNHSGHSSQEIDKEIIEDEGISR